MTPDQQQQLNTRLLEIQQRLNNFTIPILTTLNDLDANHRIAETRLLLHTIDLEFMALYKLMHTFVTIPRQSPAPKAALSIDDLEF
jgi:hypothetical protein